MKLDMNKNYIVSGIERSGTSMLMQILQAGGVPLAFNTESRPPDDNNPKGYFELEGGKIISKLMKGTFPLSSFKGKFIKITAFGVKFLPPGEYQVIYIQRNIDEVFTSMEKMAKIQDENREETKDSFIKLNNMIVSLIKRREDMQTLFVNYNDIMQNPQTHIKEIHGFLDSPEFDLNEMIGSVDKSLYRNKLT